MPENLKISLTQLFWLIGILIAIVSTVSGGAWLMSAYAGNIDANTTSIEKRKATDIEMQNWRSTHILAFTEQVLRAQSRGIRIMKLEERQDDQYNRILNAIRALKK